MADKRNILAASLIFLTLIPLAAAFQCIGLLFCSLLIERNHQRQLTLKAAFEYNAALAKLRHVRRRIVRRHGRLWRNLGRTDQWWQNMFKYGVLPEAEWKNNFQMERQIFMELADELQPYLQPSRSPQGLDVLSVEKQLGITLYYLKDQGSLMMTANTFGVALCTVSVIVHKVCDALVNILGPTCIKLPSVEDEMREQVKHMENKI